MIDSKNESNKSCSFSFHKNLPLYDRPITCIRCKDDRIILDRQKGDLICGNCGEVNISRIIDAHEEWITYANDDQGDALGAARASSCDSLFAASMTDFIGCSEEKRQAMLRAQEQAMDPKELKILQNIHHVKDIGSRLCLTSQIIKQAEEIFGNAILLDCSMFCKNKSAIAAAAIYISCRQGGYPRTADEISMATSLSRTLILKLQGVIAKQMKIVLRKVQPQSFIHRIASRMNVPENLIEQMYYVCTMLSQLSVAEDINCNVIVAYAILIISIITKFPLDIDQLLKVLYSSLESLKKCYIIFRPFVIDILPDAVKILFDEGSFPTIFSKKIFIENMTPSKSNSCNNSITSTSSSSTCFSNSKKRPPSKLFTATTPAIKEKRSRISL